MKASEKIKTDTRWVFIKQGTCSRTFFYLLNREFGHPREAEERAIDPLAGGIMQNGYQCGQLWGAVMAVGAEALRKTGNLHQATGLAILSGKKLLDSFASEAGSPDCEDFMQADMSKKSNIPKLLINGKFYQCFKLADKWAPKAIAAANKGLAKNLNELPETCLSCASEVVKKLGGNNEQMAMVAGFAGGIGLNGGGCGALAAAIWMRTFLYEKEHGKTSYPNPGAKKALEIFLNETDYEFECTKITGKKFASLNEHTTYVKEGGCNTLIEKLGSSN